MKKAISLLVSLLLILAAFSACTPEPTKEKIIMTDRAYNGLRREISPTNPMFLRQCIYIHPQHNLQGVIDTTPKDIRKFTVILLDFSWDIPDSKNEAHFFKVLDGALEVCRKNDIQAIYQISVGDSVYVNETHIDEMYQKYPNTLIGVCFVEQGFTNIDYIPRHIELAHKYGAFVYWADRDAFLLNGKSGFLNAFNNSPHLWEASKKYSENFIIGYKNTAFGRFTETEALTAGLWLSGHAGNFASRPDGYSWPALSRRVPLTGDIYESQMEGNGKLGMFLCPETLLTMSILNSALMGATVFDGPEDPMYSQTSNGVNTPAFDNCTYQAWHLIANGTVKIPTKKEVLNRVEVAYQPDTNYIDTELFEGLYEGDELLHRSWLKKSGRYFYIPILPINSGEAETSPFKQVIKESEKNNYWSSREEKVNFFNKKYEAQYSGDMYVLHADKNTFYAYNPNMNENINTYAQIPLKINSASEMLLDFSVYTYAVIKENSDNIKFYLNNYFTDKSAMYSDKAFYELDKLQTYINNQYIKNPNDKTLRPNIITIKDCTEKPTYTLTDVGKHQPSNAVETYSNGTYTLVINHNGPVELEISCKGSGKVAPLAPEKEKPIVIRDAKKFIAAEGCNEKPFVEGVNEGAAWDPQGICIQPQGYGSFAKYKNIDFGSGITKATFRVFSESDGRLMELRVGSTEGKLIGTLKVNRTGNWPEWGWAECDISGVKGVNDLYLVFKDSAISVTMFKFE
jgi:hypothetical protein